MNLRLVKGRWTPSPNHLRLGLPPLQYDQAVNDQLVKQSLSPLDLPPISTLKGKSFWGIQLPKKPPPPGPEGENALYSVLTSSRLTLGSLDCCQSGCAVCVYDLYLEDSQFYHSQLSDARDQLTKMFQSNPSKFEYKDWPDELGSFQDFMRDMKQESSMNPEEVSRKKAQAELDKVKESLDPATR